MKAIILKSFGSTDNLVYTDIETPAPGENEVLVKVKAISINPVDVKTRAGNGMAGRMKAFEPLILGWDISGTVVATGENASSFKEGDEVFGMVNFPGHGQAYAEYVAVPETQLALKPAGIPHEEAAAATLAALTAWQAVVHQYKVKKGDQVLIHAAAGGVGHYAVQLAKYFGAYVAGTSSASKKELVLSMGADEHIDYNENPGFISNVRGYDFVLDTIGGTTIERSVDVAKQGGTIISIPSGLNETVTQKARDKGVNGFFFLVQSSGEDMRALADLLERKVIRSLVSKTFTFDQMADAHNEVATGRTAGKVVVTL